MIINSISLSAVQGRLKKWSNLSKLSLIVHMKDSLD
jgi:hypothetical protein